jgi:hypothetical protein
MEGILVRNTMNSKSNVFWLAGEDSVFFEEYVGLRLAISAPLGIS